MTRTHSAPASGTRARPGRTTTRMAGTTAHGAAALPVTRVGFATIARLDTARREVELCATSEALDQHGMVFDYAASKDAFTRWIGNVREMHARQAVGSRVGIRCDDEAKRIWVRVRISRGAEDTWQKLLDGTLRGASIGASNVTWERQQRSVAGQERALDVATRYDLVELSLVDSPSNPDALGVTIVRDAAPDPAMLDDLDAGEPAPSEALHLAADAVLRGCGCPRCAGALAALAGEPDAARDVHPEVTRESLRRMEEQMTTLRSLVQAGISQMAATVGDLGTRLRWIEDQPLPGGPLAAEPRASRRHDYDAVIQSDAHLHALEGLAGRLVDPQAQIAVAAEIIRLRREAGH